MEKKDLNFGNIWWHRVLKTFYVAGYIIVFCVITFIAGGMSYSFIVDEGFGWFSVFSISALISLAFVALSVIFFEAIKFLFFYIYQNRLSYFKKDVIKSLKRQTTVIGLICILSSVIVAVIFGNNHVRYADIQQEYSSKKSFSNLQEFPKKEEINLDEIIKENKREREEFNAALKVKSVCEEDIGLDYELYYGICGNDSECLKGWFSRKGYSGDKKVDIELCIKIRS